MAHNLTVDECLAMLKDPSLKAESIAEEMECAGVKRPQPAEVQAARDALTALDSAALAPQGPEGRLAAAVAALPEMLALALVHAAGRESQQEVLRELAQGSNKTLAKEAKRELHRLKQKGVEVAELPRQGEPVLRPIAEAEAPACYVSSIDAYGERAVWWTRPARQGVEVVQVVASDVKGILAVDALALSRRSWREFVKRLPRQGVVTSAEVSKDHARQIIADAEAEGSRNGFSPPPSYGDALRLLGPAPEVPQPSPGMAIAVDDELAHSMAGAALFDDPLFLAWIPEEDALRSFALKVDEIAVSQLYLDQPQRQQAFERAADEAATAYFTPRRRTLYSKRLVEMAHVLASEARHDAAKTAVAVARALAAGGPTPFARALFTHALQGHLEKKAAAAAQPASAPAAASPILTP